MTEEERYLLGGVAIGPGGEGEEHGVPQESEVGVEPWRPQSRPQVDRQAALDQGADQLAEGPGQRVFLAAGLDLVELHLGWARSTVKSCNTQKFPSSVHRDSPAGCCVNMQSTSYIDRSLSTACEHHSAIYCNL